MTVSRLVLTAALILPVLITIFGFPIILLARVNRLIGSLYYFLVFTISDFLVLSRADDNVRLLLFKTLDHHIELCQCKTKGGSPVKILEIGPGTGGNFKYFPEGTKLTTLEFNPWLENHAMMMKKRYPNITSIRSIVGNAEEMKMIENESFDFVVGTHILCCIKDVTKAIQEIHRILKPEGAFVSSEFVFFPKQKFLLRIIQELYAPFWRFFGLGCRAGSQDSTILLELHGFDVTKIKSFINEDLPVTHALTHYGVAVKKVRGK